MENMRIKLTSMIVLVVLVSAGLLFLFSYQRSRDSMSAQMEASYSIVAEKYAQELTAWINTNATIIDSLAAEITTSGIYNDGYEAFHAYLAKNYELLNKDGRIYDIYFTYPDNHMACASDFIADGSVDYVRTRDWFVLAAGTGELFYSTPYRDSDTGKPVITISKGVYVNNVLQGVLAADIFVDVLVDIIRQADVAPNSYAFLVDQNLGMIVHPNPAYTFGDVPHGVMDVPDAPYGDVISKIRSGSSETVYLIDYDGVERGIVVAKMKNTGWYVGIATSKAELMQGVDAMIRGLLIAAVIAVVIGGVIAMLLAHVLDKMSRQQQEYETQVRTLESRMVQVKKATRSSLPELSDEAPQSGQTEEIDVSGRIKLLVPMMLIFLLMVGMVIYTSRAIRDVAVTNIREVGEDRISAAAAELENYLETSKSTLWVTADTVDHMIRSGTTPEKVLDYITVETQNQKQHFDVNITGIYGYVMGEYLDGLAWVPPENYDPTRRDWYRAAVEADGEATIIAPYVDAQTNDIIISISRMLSNGKDVLSVDVMMNQIQQIVSNLHLKGKGYGFIVDRDGMLIAHQDEEKSGRYLTEEEDQLILIDKILEIENGTFEIKTGRSKSTVFVRQIAEQWYVVIVIDNRELTAEVRQQMVINVLICAVIFALIAFFYLLGHRNEKAYSGRIAQMRAEEQKQAYEARVLKLEKAAADQANKAKSDFLAEMSHEIRTPINAVLGMNEMILRESMTDGEQIRDPAAIAVLEDIRSYAGDIESAGNSLLTIINDILDFSKIEAGRLEIAEGAYQLSSLLNDVSNMVFFRAKEKGLDFVLNVDPAIPDGLYGDEARLRQIITNLLTNAVKYTHQGSIQLTVRGKAETLEIGRPILLTVSVKDTGIGIRPEDQEKLFTKFQRVDLQHNSTVEGTGLGLAITRSLLTLMGGEIHLESVYGEGSTFTVTVPQKIRDPEPIEDFHTRFRENMAGMRVYETSFLAPDAQILIVDDTRMNLTVAKALLKKTKTDITTAISGAEAVELAGMMPFDLILMDQRMPEMDGSEAMRLIRKQEGSPNRSTPIICLTADAVIGARERYLAQGFTDYLTKPIDSAALEKMLLKYLPKEKVIPQTSGATTAQRQTADEFAFLYDFGVDVKAGLGYCQGDANLYRTMLLEFVQGAEERRPKLQAHYDAGDWKNYAVLVHALKSSARMIGAKTLAEMAAELEAAADHAETDTVSKKHSMMMEQYCTLVDKLSILLKLFDAEIDDNEVMEFLPEDDQLI